MFLATAVTVTTVKFDYQWPYHSREINLSMIVIFVWCCLFPICKYLGTLKSFVEKKYTHFGLHILWNFPCKANTSLPVLFLLFGKGIPWLNMSKSARQSPMMPNDIMLLHLFNPFLFFFPSVFSYLTNLKLVRHLQLSLEISAMCACKSSFHQDGLKEELDFEVPRFSPFFY